MPLIANDNARIISIKTAAAMTSLLRPSINSLRQAGLFPAAIQLGERRIGFIRAEVESWIDAHRCPRAEAA